MVDLNVNIRSSGQEPKFVDNISVSHKMGVHKHTATDNLEQSSSLYQEDRVPAADYPELSDVLTNLSTTIPKPSLVAQPKDKFAEHLKEGLLHLSDEQMSQIKQAVPSITHPTQALKLLLFAWSHPGVPLDPQVTKILKELVDQAKEETIKEYNLPDDWSPPTPDAQKSDEKIAKFYDDKFAEQANKLAKNPGDAKTLIAAHYQQGATLSPELKELFSQVETAATDETQNQLDLPKEFKLPSDKMGFNIKMSMGLAETFQELVAKEKGLTDEEKAELATLHSDPNADVKDKKKLLNLFNKLNAQAKAKMTQENNLPDNFKFLSNKEPHEMKASGQFLADFEEKVNNQTSPPLSRAQKELLLATRGVNSNNLPPELKALFDKLKGETLNDIMDRLGLPKDWQPKIKTDAQSKKIEGKEGAKESEGTEETEKEEGVQGFSMKGQREVRGASESISMDGFFEKPPPDIDLQKKVINHYVEYSTQMNAWVNKYLNMDETMQIGDALLVVHLALDKLRNGVYAIQTANSKMAVKYALMQKEVTQFKILKQKEQMAEMRKQQEEHPKECFLYKVLDIICPVPVVHDIIEGAVQIFFYALDMILLGGMLSTIFTAAGSEPPGKSPLVMMGVDPATSDIIDMVVGIVIAIILVVIEIVISCLLAQPELVALEIAQISAQIGAMSAKIAVQTAIRVAQAALTAAIKAGAKLTVKAVEKAVEDAVKQVLKEIAKRATKEATKKLLKETIPQFAKTVAKREAKKLMKKLTEKVEDVQDMGKAVSKFAQKGVKEIAEEGAELALKKGEAILEKMEKLLKMVKNEDEAAMKALAKAGRRIKKTTVGDVLGKYQVIMELQTVLQDACQAAQGFVNFAMQSKKADLHNKIAELQAEIELLDADLQVIKRSMKMVENAMVDAASWISDINKQESQFYQKMQVHFIAA